ncbi:2'-5' RNA ligase family protein [uncultured Hymenobacter sp.]|uniref:2'-5' RNA ligase family protein n=1 Tax=uncultured Hymenobacter sp. TaxID=170016 RepID=UPI0035C9566A
MPYPPAGPEPLILTLALDPESQAFFDELRQRHFPPQRNFLSAHLTLFHALPGAAEATISAYLQATAAAHGPLALAVAGVQFMGQGVMYKLESPDLRRLHKTLQTAWQTEFGFALSGQDRQPLHPHITVQNKVTPAVARALHEELSAGFQPFTAGGVALRLWAYKGGPWEEKGSFAFKL